MKDTHYILEVEIKKVSKASPGTGRANADTPAGPRIVEDVARIIVKASELEGLLAKGRAHLSIVEDNEL